MTARFHPSAESGFAMVELLVAIAIASLVVAGVGGVLVVVSSFRERAHETASVMSALVDLQAFGALLVAYADQSVTEAAPDQFLLSRDRAPAREQPQRVAIKQHDGAVSIVFTRRGIQSSVDLTAFETASLEYLVPSQPTDLWQPGSSRQSEPVRAARLVLQLGNRIWRPMIWAGNATAEP